MEINNLEKFLAKVRAGQCPLGGCVSFSDPAVTEVVAEAGIVQIKNLASGEQKSFDKADIPGMTNFLCGIPE